MLRSSSNALCRYCLCRQSQRLGLSGATVRSRSVLPSRHLPTPRYSTAAQAQLQREDTATDPDRAFPRPYTLPPQNSPAREATLKDGGRSVPGTPITAANPPGSAANSTTTTANATERKKRPRARKAVLTLTADAVDRLKEIQSADGKFIKVSVVAKGCAGGAYKLEYVDSAGRFDEKVEQDGVTVLVDSKSLMKIIGSEMGYSDDILASRFTFNNPNVVSTCGCEESFATKEDEERLLGHGRV